MKARPYRIDDGNRYEVCDPAEATHLEIIIPGPTGRLMLPVQIKGTRAGTGNWTWNGDTKKPTLKPSVLVNGNRHLHNPAVPRCHTWITDGQAQFLSDCTHELAGQTLELLDVDATL